MRVRQLRGNIDYDQITPEMLYRSSLWWRGHAKAGGADLSALEYLSSLAHKGPIALYDNTTDHNPPRLGTLVLKDVHFESYAAMNQAYMTALPYMHEREILDGAVLWHPAGSRSLTPGAPLSFRINDQTPRVLFLLHENHVSLPPSLSDWTATTIFGDNKANMESLTLKGKHQLVLLKPTSAALKQTSTNLSR